MPLQTYNCLSVDNGTEIIERKCEKVQRNEIEFEEI